MVCATRSSVGSIRTTVPAAVATQAEPPPTATPCGLFPTPTVRTTWSVLGSMTQTLVPFGSTTQTSPTPAAMSDPLNGRDTRASLAPVRASNRVTPELFVTQTEPYPSAIPRQHAPAGIGGRPAGSALSTVPSPVAHTIPP